MRIHFLKLFCVHFRFKHVWLYEWDFLLALYRFEVYLSVTVHFPPKTVIQLRTIDFGYMNWIRTYIFWLLLESFILFSHFIFVFSSSGVCINTWLIQLIYGVDAKHSQPMFGQQAGVFPPNVKHIHIYSRSLSHTHIFTR